MKRKQIFWSLFLLIPALFFSFQACEVTECGNGVCETGEDDPADTAYCPEDCTTSGKASVSFTWYIHGIKGGVDVGWGSGSAQEVCTLVKDLLQVSQVPGVQIWFENNGDNQADAYADFNCSAGQGQTTEDWNAGDTIKFAFALVDKSKQPNDEGYLLSQSMAWDTKTLSAGNNDLGTVNFYIGDYGPLGVQITWGDKVNDPAYFDCANIEPDVTKMGYLLCWGNLSGGQCPQGNLYDEVDIATNPITCQSSLKWDIIDFGTYVLVLDGEDSSGTTLWGAQCEGLVVDEKEPNSNNFECKVEMTQSP